ncbi:type IV pilus modification PilV family protein [Halanaerobacter jeridensis]|uniref:Prepilin-type N-terminal cleavage/methylation domain-containing protein n=1 Tax=Halanaerobacter jeridensis TaxID=706427 RepID=A0A938XSH7_9FIRM|nr:prepilin-type N-terminal cleavage/methylation domain-containing protein [Halanaerobacter jeridensis]MBM7556891.1 prepilin-type N-terminal cleavage/methylation domain-containing protein [Halanaerobacter jeridensis]
MKKWIYNCEAGFSMIELLVGISILSIALVPIAGFFVNNTRMVNDIDQQSQALNLAKRVIEDLKGTAVQADKLNQDFTTQLEAAEESWNQKTPKDLQNELDVQGQYQIEVTLENHSGSDLKEVTVEVFWNSNQTDPPSVKLETLLARR